MNDENVGKPGSDGFAADLWVGKLARHKTQRVLDRGRCRECVTTDEEHSRQSAHQLAGGGIVE